MENKTLGCSFCHFCGCKWVTSILTQAGRRAIEESYAVLKPLHTSDQNINHLMFIHCKYETKHMKASIVSVKVEKFKV